MSAASSSVPAPVSSAPPTNIANLYNALLKAGVVSVDNKPNTGPIHQPMEYSAPNNASDQSRTAKRLYRKAVLSEKVKLTTADILKYVLSNFKSVPYQLTIGTQKTPVRCRSPLHKASCPV